MSAPDRTFDKSAEIAPVIASFWQRYSFRKQYQFYGQDCAIDEMCNDLKAAGFKKLFLEKKRDFIVTSILSDQSLFRQLCTMVTFYHQESNGTQRYWLGNGRITSPSHEFIQKIGSSDPMFLLIQIDVAPIYSQLQGFLQQTP